MNAKTTELNEKVREKRLADDERAARQIEGKYKKLKNDCVIKL